MGENGRVDGKVALITGGARGMGASHGRVLAAQGAKVVLADVLDDLGEETAARLRDDGLKVRYAHLDVTRLEDWDAAVRVTEGAYGKLNVLVNNAGILGSGTVIDCTLEQWHAVIAVNQTGVFLGMQRTVPAMRRAGGGSIINISSVAATLGTAFESIAYHASKAAVHLLTRAAAVTLAPEIRVNTVTPGITATVMADELGAELLAARMAAYPMGRPARPDEVSSAVLFLASDESSFTTGADLRVDGGALAGVARRRSK